MWSLSLAGSTTPTVWFRLVIRITSIINTILSMLRMAVQCLEPSDDKGFCDVRESRPRAVPLIPIWIRVERILVLPLYVMARFTTSIPATLSIFDRDDYDYVLTGREQNQIHMVAENPDELGEKRIAVGPVDYPDDIGTHVRDPKILEHDGIYYMVLGARTKDDRGCVLVYTSRNLEDWSYATRIELDEKFGFMWECPDLFELDGELILVAVRRVCLPMVGVTAIRISACGSPSRPIGRRRALKSSGRACPRWSMPVLISMLRSPLRMLQAGV